MRDTRPRPDLYDYLAVAYPGDTPMTEIQAHAAALGYAMTEHAIHKLARRRKLKRTAKMGRVPNSKKSTPQFDFLRAHYGTDATPQWLLEEVNKLGRPIPSVKAMRRLATDLGVRRPETAKLTGLVLGRGPGFAGAAFKALLAAAIPVTREVADAWARENIPEALAHANWGNRMMKINTARRGMGLPFFRAAVEARAVAPKAPAPPRVRVKQERPRPRPVTAKAPSKPRTVVVAPPPEPDPIVFLDPDALHRAVTRRGCDMPLWGDAGRPTHIYCGAPVRAGQPYCEACTGRVFTKAAGVGFHMNGWGRAA